MSRNPEPGQTNAAAPFLVLETPRGPVSIWSLGDDRFRVEAGGEHVDVDGDDVSRAAAQMFVDV